MTIEKETSLGDFLRQERETRGVTIEQVASATKVGIRSLHALEADEYAELPAKPFVRGFVTSYCRFIGLDPKEVLGRFEQYITLKSNDRPRRDGGHSGYAFEKRDGEQGRTFLVFAMIGFVLVGAVTMLVFKPSLRHHRNRSHIEKLRDANSSSKSEKGELVAKVTEKASSDKTALEKVALEKTAAPVATTDKRLTEQNATDQVGADKGVEPKVVKAEVLQTARGNSTTSGALAVTLEEKVIQGPEIQANPPSFEKKETQQNDLAQSETSQNEPGQNEKDPLDSGLTLKGSEIRHKAIFKTLEDLWVRYKVDQRPIRQFIIRKGKVLVLRATDLILFQVSNPKAMTMRYNGQYLGVLDRFQDWGSKENNATLVLPKNRMKDVEIPFSRAMLPKTPDPRPDFQGSENSPESESDSPG